ncbi:hypothetical protein BVC80_613g12 [Macleaya cordata]|uniref:Poly(ADP-ribose) polymerase n=1 Tax=Macleaya cordata TaxID=56857 RepID=A0A200QXG8_MACCD|nr:hypothetical protein BVC80_613g12 [Macleaya cordata]
MIFQTATTTTHTSNIERVLRVRNSAETLERFEEYREMVKERAHCNAYMYHPRSVVDGNEVLRIYRTTMNCCSRKQNKVSELCYNLKCGVCRMIRTGFDTEATKKTGIQLNADCETLGDCGMDSVDKGENVKRAVVVCRVIAGTFVNTVEGGYDSSVGGAGGLCSKFEHLFVRNPNAVLPCFVIVFA